MKSLEKISRAISIFLHPIFMGVYGISLLFLFTDAHMQFGAYFRFILPVFILSCLLPANGIFLLKRFNLISDYSLSERKDRYAPFLVTFVSYAFLLYFYNKPYIPFWFITTLAIPMVLLVIAAVVNIWWKISAHMMGIGGLIGCALSIAYVIKGVNPYWLFILLFVLAGCLGTARLVLKRHSPAQVYVGFCVGMIVSYFCIYFSLYFTIFKLVF